MIFNISDIPEEMKPGRVILVGTIKKLLKNKGTISCVSSGEFSNKHRDLVYLMMKTCLSDDGIGLSATQIGRRERCFVMRANETQFHAFFDPSWNVHENNNLEDSVENEGCLSVPGYQFRVPRLKAIGATWSEWNSETNTWETKTSNLYDLPARCFQHEFDHLQGISVIERAEDLNRDAKRNLLKTFGLAR